MRRALTTVILAAAIGMVAAATASATVSPTGAKTGTTGAVTFAGVNCTAGSFTGTWASSPTISTNMRLQFTGCTRPGGLLMTIACTNTGVLSATGSTVSGITPLSITALSCRVSVTAAPTCTVTVTGSVTGSYSNISQLTIGAGGSLTGSGSTCVTLPNGAKTISGATYAVTPATTMSF
jgi:hypothetical protein